MANVAIVVTTINHPTKAVLELNKNSASRGIDFYLIGDSKSPKDFTLSPAKYFDIEKQKKLPFRFASLCPEKHYARKNVGYLLAMRAGADIIIETDDDNIPRDEFWNVREREIEARCVSGSEWCNVYRYFTDSDIWPRGLPLDHVRRDTVSHEDLQISVKDCPIQQALADGDPDVDAVYRLLFPLPVHFDRRAPIALDKGVWCPFNSQNTTFWRDAFPLLYLPYYCSFRMTDIWRSFVAQRILWECGWNIAFFNATVHQERNEHDLMRDFSEEVPGYMNNDRIRKSLEDLPLKSGSDSIAENMKTIYNKLIDMNLITSDENVLLNSWLEDIAKINEG